MYATFISSDDANAHAMMLAQSGERVIGLLPRGVVTAATQSTSGGGTPAVPPKTTSKSGVDAKAVPVKRPPAEPWGPKLDMSTPKETSH